MVEKIWLFFQQQPSRGNPQNKRRLSAKVSVKPSVNGLKIVTGC
jgi:hypothetical protein